MRKIKVGVCIPPLPYKGQTASTRNAGTGCIPLATHKKLMEMLERLDTIDLYPYVNFRNSVIRDGKVYVDDLCLNDLDIFFWYCQINRSYGSYDLEVLKTLAGEVKVVVNPKSFEIGLDKYASHLVLKRAGVSVAETMLFEYENLHYMRKIFDEWGAAVLKPRRGAFGKGVTFINSFATLRDIIEYLHSTVGTTPDKAYMLERFYENCLDKWVGTTLINGELMYGYRKRKTRLAEMGNGFQKVYDADEIGGEMDGCEVPQSYKEEALKAYQAIGAEIIGFDMIFNRGQPIIIDANTFPGYYEEIFKQVGRDSAEEFYKLIVSEINKIVFANHS